MKAFVVFESVFGATRQIAEAIEVGLGEFVTAELVNVHAVRSVVLGADDLLVVGAPTHARSLPTAASRADGAAHSSADYRSHKLEPDPFALGVREWLDSLRLDGTSCAAFSSRAQIARLLSGSAAVGILKRLQKAGGRQAIEPQDFVVDKQGAPVAGELARAEDWGRALGAQMREAYTAGAA